MAIKNNKTYLHPPGLFVPNSIRYYNMRRINLKYLFINFVKIEYKLHKLMAVRTRKRFPPMVLCCTDFAIDTDTYYLFKMTYRNNMTEAKLHLHSSDAASRFYEIDKLREILTHIGCDTLCIQETLSRLCDLYSNTMAYAKL